jgi:Cys-rich protein (TIGR01571 family)
MTEQWQTGLLGCLDDKSSCIDSICCWCCQIGRQCAALDGKVNENSYLYCCLALFFQAHWLLICCLRCKVSSKYQLDEGCIGSICKGYFCPLCSLCQTHRELTVRNAWPGGFCVKQPFQLMQ